MKELKVKWEDIGIANDFMFGKVMQDPELCKELLQVILPELEIERIEYPEIQKSIDLDKEAHGIRLDVYVKDNRETVYNIEMQTVVARDLPKRSRYYQDMMDLQLLDKGESYQKLKRSYVIFICTFDLFGAGLHKYEFEYICKQNRNISLGDETVKIFLNACGIADDVSDELKAFLNYVTGKKSDDSFVQKLDDAVDRARKNREWRHEYMTLAMRDLINREEGRKEGIIGMVAALKELNIPDEVIIQKIEEKFQLSNEEAQEILNG